MSEQPKKAEWVWDKRERFYRLTAGECQLTIQADQWGCRGKFRIAGDVEAEEFDAAQNMLISHARRLLTEALAALPEEDA